MSYECRTGWTSVVLAAGLTVAAQANNIRVANVLTRDQDVGAKQATIGLDLSWENSWRNDLNHDAAWVFVKFRAPESNTWQHAFLSTNGADHTAPGGTVSVGVTEVGGTDRGMGVFVARAGAHTGAVDIARIRLRWDYGASGYAFAKGAQVEISVHAIEMVYVPEGSFRVGCGGSESGSFTAGPWLSGPSVPFAITSESALTITNIAGHLWGTSISGNNTIGAPGELPAAFPKGFGAFYCMKYPVTQGQYADFLNLLTQAQANTRWLNSYGTQRNIVKRLGEAGSYTYSAAEAPDRACNYLSWGDDLAYADWAGLRPMTELEYEKACRGPAEPVPAEYAWGTAAYTAQTGYDPAAAEGSGIETATPAGANFNAAYNTIPVRRVGIYAATAAADADITRRNAGASYWGIPDLSGYPSCRMVSVGTAAGRAFAGLHGDGAVNASGNADVPTWPGGAGSGWRGGGYWGNNHPNAARVSSRAYAANIGDFRFYEIGFRAVRTAP